MRRQDTASGRWRHQAGKPAPNPVDDLAWGRIRRGGYLIDWWIGDHGPEHVHVYRNGAFVAKVEVPGMLVLSGRMSRRLRRILQEVIEENLL